MPGEAIGPILQGLGAVAGSLGIGSGGQDIKEVIPGGAQSVASQIQRLLDAQQQRVFQSSEQPLIFPDNFERASALTGPARIAGLPTGTVGFRPAAAEFARGRDVDLGFSGFTEVPGFIDKDDPFDDDNGDVDDDGNPIVRQQGVSQTQGPGRQQSNTSVGARNSILTALRQILDTPSQGRP